ncbi:MULTISPECIES: polysaccharide biosynthesis tyrosine autokinase [Microbacterium]|uniref:polysaccharide biosynthesis tyrosine autokinase n=1 Tax=Microbacterium TaxID=33882 RepID=UPI0022EFE4AE|nr:polysaccharide biosynthesis tyrosine autokinase [Streptomyces sp. MS2A]
MKSENSAWTLGSVVGALTKFWYLIVGLTILGGVAGFAVSATTTPQFESRATLFFALNQGNSASDLNQGSTYTQGQMLSFAQIASSSRVLGAVIDDLGLDATPRELARTLAITIPQDTAILEVKASSPDPKEAAEVANAVSQELSDVVRDVAPKGPEGAPTITASIIDEAVVPAFQSSPNKPRDTVLAAVLGLVVGILAAFAVAVADTRVRNERALAAVTDAPLLGTVTRVRGGETGLIVVREPKGHVAEDFRRVQSALAFASLDGGTRRLLVTSATPGEGKSTFSANLAATLAELGEDALLVDADLRRPRAAEIFGLESAAGLTDVVRGTLTLEEAVVEGDESRPDLLLSGDVPPNAATILTSHAFETMLSDAAAEHDVVIIDSPPVLTVADTNLLAPLADGVIVVVDASRTRRAQLAATLRSLEAAGARIVGVVLNKVRLERGRQSYYTD